MMSTHKALVSTIHRFPQGDAKVKPGQLVTYRGEHDWKYEPLDPELRKEWAETVTVPDDIEKIKFRDRGGFAAPRDTKEVIAIAGPRVGMKTVGG